MADDKERTNDQPPSTTPGYRPSNDQVQDSQDEEAGLGDSPKSISDEGAPGWRDQEDELPLGGGDEGAKGW